MKLLRNLLLIVLLALPTTAKAVGNETINTLPDSNKASFRVDSQNFWKNEIPNILHRYAEKSFVYTGGIHGPSSSCSSAPFSLEAFTNAGNRVTANAVSINYAAIGANCSSDVCWVIASPNDAVGGYQRVGSTHLYANCSSPTLPTSPQDSVDLMKVTLNGGAITFVEDLRKPASLARNGTYDVTNPFYGGVADDFTDIGPAITGAIASAVPQRGIVIYIPQGVYALKSPVVIPDGVGIIIKGDGWAADRSQTRGINTFPRRGTWIHINNPAFSAFIISGTGVTIKDIAFDYDQPVPGPGWAPIGYPATFQINTENSWFSADINIENIFLNKAFNGVNQTSLSGMSSARINIKGLWGQIFGTGIRLEFVADVPRISDVHFWPYWSFDSNVATYQYAHTIGFDIGRADSLMMHDIFILGATVGFQFSTVPFGSATGLQATNISTDAAVISILIGQPNFSGQFANLRTYGAWDGITYVPGFAQARGIAILGENARVDIANWEVGSLGGSCGSIAGNGSSVRVHNFMCAQFNLNGEGRPALETSTGGNFALGGFQQFIGAHGAPSYSGNFITPVNPNGVIFNSNSTFFANTIGGAPTISFAAGAFLDWSPINGIFKIGSPAGNYNTGGVIKPLCMIDGSIIVCP
jgi:hypothetical protein